MPDPPVAGESKEPGPKPTTYQPTSAWSEVLLRSSVIWVALVIASVAEPTPNTVPVEGERPVFWPPAGCTEAKAAARLVLRLITVTLVSELPLAKLTEPFCTVDPSFNWIACQLISVTSSGEPAVLRSNVTVLAS